MSIADGGFFVAGNLVVSQINGVDQVKGLLRYLALLTQSSTSAPVATVLESNLPAAIVWTRTSAGLYVGTLAGVFTASKTVVRLSNSVTSAIVSAARTNADTVTLKTYAVDGDGPAIADAQLSGSVIEIIVYP